MPVEDYSDRQNEKRERLEDRADKLQRHGEARAEAGRAEFQGMDGQPILVGHHSEKRHRAAIVRADNNLRKGFEDQGKAKELQRRATRLGSSGVSSDDPEAVQKLTRKLEALEHDRDKLKAMNTAWRKAGKPASDNDNGWREVAESMNLDPEGRGIVALRDGQREHYMGDGRQPIEGWQITNLSANIRSTRKRIEALREEYQRQDAGPTDDIVGEGYKVSEDVAENRLCCYFDERPSREVCRAMRRAGWRWNRRLTAWTRLLNNTSRNNAIHQLPGYIAAARNETEL